MKHKPVKISKLYRIEGGKLVRQEFCPRCGEGVFLAKHENRLTCGKCHYTKFIKKD